MAPVDISQGVLQTLAFSFKAEGYDEDHSSYGQAAAYLSARILTVGGVALLLLGLCCVFAVLIRFNRHQHHQELQRVVFVQTRVLDQSSINKSFPIRMWPSQERLMQDDERRVKAIERVDETLKATAATKTMREQWPTSRKGYRLLFKGLLPGSAAAASRSSSYNTPEGSIPLSSIPSVSHECKLDVAEQACGLEGSQDTCCSICLAEYLYEDRLRILPCSHEYHADCVDIWLMCKSTQCPLCKHDLLEDVGTGPPASTWPAIRPAALP